MAMDYLRGFQLNSMRSTPSPVYSYRGYQNTIFPPAHTMSTYLPDPQWHKSAPFARHKLLHQNQHKAAETKPRLAKDDVEVLEAEFQKNYKPNSALKKALAERMGLEIARVNNWFQNRRAKEKQLIRTREAQEVGETRKLEGADSQPSSPDVKEHYQSSGQREDLRPSTAEFAINAHDDSVELLPADAVSASFEPIDAIENDQIHSGYASTHTLTPQEAAQSLELQSDQDYFSRPCDYTGALPVSTHAIPEPIISTQMPIHDSEAIARTLEGAGQLQAAFVQYPMLPGAADVPYGGVMGHPQADIPQQSIEYSFQHVSPEPVAQSPPIPSPPIAVGMRFKSPTPIGLAGRRNRPLPSIHTDSHPGGPKTGFDLGKHYESGRRASASAAIPSNRVQKLPSATPRSPYFGGRTEALLHAVRSPTIPMPFGSRAPPTPNTPVISNHREATVSSTSSEEEKALMYLPFQDPTIKTPPQTPSLLNFSFQTQPHSLEATLNNYTAADEATLTPGFTTFNQDYQIPTYITETSSSQPPTPAFPPAVMGPGFYRGFPGSQEYFWEQQSLASNKSSPTTTHRQKPITFANLTQRDFNHAEK